MIWNYNGTISRAMLLDLKRICSVNEENHQALEQALSEKGVVSIYTNLDPFTGYPDELSGTVTLNTSAEVSDYLYKDFVARVDGYLHSKKHAQDILLDDIVEFIKATTKYPTAEEMRQLEIAAEHKRIQTETTNADDEFDKTDVKQAMMKEILQLAEAIIETRRDTNPESVSSHPEPYHDDMHISTDEFSVTIYYDSHYGTGTYRDYSISVRPHMQETDIENLLMGYQNNGKCYRYAEIWRGVVADDDETDSFIAPIHKLMIALAEQEGLEFLSEIEYDE